MGGRIPLRVVAVWLLGFGLVAYLSLEGGGYDSVVRGQLGILALWALLLGLAVGALPLERPPASAWVALGLFAAYVGWVALSFIWTDGPEATFADLGRVLVYLGVFALALAVRGRHGARRMVAALAAAIAAVAVVALLSRLHPSWFPEAADTARFLDSTRNRLAHPLGYWNGLGSLLAIGLPLVLYVACCARTVAARALAVAALPALALALYFTFSRGGTLAALVAVAAFFALAHDRLPKLATALPAACGGAVLILAASGREALDAGLAGPLAREQGDEMLLLTLLVCAAVGVLQAGVSLLARRARRPAWSRPPRALSLALVGVAFAAAVGVGVALDADGRAADAWDEFRQAKAPPKGADRFTSFASNGRWPLWQSALDQAEAAPLVGEGAGSFERWWARNGAGQGYVRDAHSLYFETLGELGVVGLALIVAFLGWVLLAGARRYAEAAPRQRTQLGAALAGCVAFCLGAGFDWIWELAVIPIVFLLLASVLVGADEERREAPLWRPLRAVGAALCLAAMAAIAIPLATDAALERSRAEARAGDLDAALGDARDAQRVEPFAAGPRLQEALVLEAQRRLAAAAAAARDATRLEPEQWRPWVVLSRLEARRGNPAAALAAYRQARQLNPRSPLLRTPP